MGRRKQPATSRWITSLCLLTCVLLSVLANDAQNANSALVSNPSQRRRILSRPKQKLFVGEIDGSISSVDANTGTIEWTFDTGSPLISSSRDSDSKVQVFPGIDGSVYVLEDEKSSHLELSHVKVSELVENSPSLTGDGFIILGSQSATLYYVNSETGTILKTVIFDDNSDIDVDVLANDAKEENVILFVRKDYKVKSVAKIRSPIRWSISFAEIHHLNPASISNRQAFVEYLKGKQDLPETNSVNGPLVLKMGNNNSLHVKDQKSGWNKWSISFNSTPVVFYNSENASRNLITWDYSFAMEKNSEPANLDLTTMLPATRRNRMDSRVIVGSVSPSDGGLYAIPVDMCSLQDKEEQFKSFNTDDKKMFKLVEGKGQGEIDSLQCALNVMETSDQWSLFTNIWKQMMKQITAMNPISNAWTITAIIALTIIACIAFLAVRRSRKKCLRETSLGYLKCLSPCHGPRIKINTKPISRTCDGVAQIAEDGTNKEVKKAHQGSSVTGSFDKETVFPPQRRKQLRPLRVDKEIRFQTPCQNENSQNEIKQQPHLLEYSVRKTMTYGAQNQRNSNERIVELNCCPSPTLSVLQRLPTQEELLAWSSGTDRNPNSSDHVLETKDEEYRMLGRSLLNEVNEPSAFEHFDQRFGQSHKLLSGSSVPTLVKQDDTFDLTPTAALSTSPIHADWGSSNARDNHPFNNGYSTNGKYSSQQKYYQQYLDPLSLQGKIINSMTIKNCPCISPTFLGEIQGSSSLNYKSLHSNPNLDLEKFSIGNYKEGTIFKVGKLFVGPGVLGYGTSGTIVFEGHFHGQKVAVKRILKTFCDAAANEKDILIFANEHPNLVRLFAVEEDNDFIFLVLERCQMSLHDFISTEEGHFSLIENGRPSKKCISIMLDICEGLSALHSRGVVHRDLKPHNVLLTESLRAKLSDMGLGRQLVPDQSSLFSNGSGWQAPEQLIIKQGGAARQSKAMDVFSLGCTMYHCISGGRHPFGESSYTRDDNILKQSPHLDALDDIPEGKDLIASMLDKDPVKRPSIEEVKEHPFWWSSRKKLGFLIELSDRVENEDRQDDKTLFRAFEDVAVKATGGNWGARLDPLLVTNLGQYRKYTFTSLRDLLRVIRNKHNHYRELPASLKQAMGSIPDGFCNYFVSRFPNLLMTTYLFVKEYLSSETPMDKYFLATLERRTSADSLSSPSSMPAIEEEIDLDPSHHGMISEEESAEAVSDETEDDGKPRLQVRTKPINSVFRTISGDSTLSGGTGTPWDSVLNVIMENTKKNNTLYEQDKDMYIAGQTHSPLRLPTNHWTPQIGNEGYLSARTPARSPNRLHPRGFDSLINIEREPRLEVDVKKASVDPYRELQSPIRLSEGSKKYEDPTRPIVGWEEDPMNQNYTQLPFPQRPGSAICDFYQKTGFCKYHERCRFHHPPECAVRLNEDGLPVRQGEPVCEFYKSTHQCKFGGACKFNHPNMKPIYAGSLNHA
eukprot:g1405.t1